MRCPSGDHAGSRSPVVCDLGLVGSVGIYDIDFPVSSRMESNAMRPSGDHAGEKSLWFVSRVRMVGEGPWGPCSDLGSLGSLIALFALKSLRSFALGPHRPRLPRLPRRPLRP